MVFSNRNITLTTNRLTQIKTNPIAACCKILNHFLYFSSDPAAVTIWKPHQSKTTKAINANIPNIQLMNTLITLINVSFVLAPVHDTPTFVVAVASQKPEGVFCANVNKLPKLSTPNVKTDKTFNDNFFIFFSFLKKLKRLSYLYNRFIEYEIKFFLQTIFSLILQIFISFATIFYRKILED